MCSIFTIVTAAIIRGLLCIHNEFFVVVVCVGMCLILAYPADKCKKEYTTEELVESVNSGELIMLPNDRVRKVNGDYVVEKEDNTYEKLNENDIEYIDDDENVYVSLPSKESDSQQTEEKVYILDCKRYIDEGDGTLREIQIVESN